MTRTTKKFEPSTKTNKVKVKKKSNTSKLTNQKKDTEVLISKLQVIRRELNRMENIISDKDLMINIVNNLPVEYYTVVEAIEGHLTN